MKLRSSIALMASSLTVSLAIASGGDDAADAVTLDAASARQLPMARFDQEGVVVALGPTVVVPVKQHGETIGVGFVGQGPLQVHFAHRADAERYANRQVRLGRRPVADLQAVAHGTVPLSLPVSKGFVFGNDDLLKGWLEGTPVDGAQAARSLEARMKVLDAAFRLDQGQDVVEDDWSLADFCGPEPLRYVLTNGSGGQDDDRCLSPHRDGLRSTVLAIGRDESRTPRVHTVALGPWQPTPGTEAGTTPDGVITTRADATITTQGTRLGARLKVDVDATLHLKTGQAVSALRLWIPHGASFDAAWQVGRITLNGTPLSVPPNLDRGADIPLPEPLPAGSDAELHVVYTDAWNLAAGGEDTLRATGLHDAVPTVSGTESSVYTLKVGTLTASKLVSAQSGIVIREWDEGEVHWVESHEDRSTRDPLVAFGDWVTHAAPSIEGLPTMRINLFRTEAAGIAEFPPFLRSILAYYHQLLPPFPTTELEILQRRDAFGHFTWTSNPGLVTVQQMKTFGSGTSIREDRPHLEAEVLAHEVAHQWWGASIQPARPEDGWMSETMATVYACLFVGAAYGPKDCEVRQESWRKTWEQMEAHGVEGSMQGGRTRPYWSEIAYEYGPYVLLHMLRGRLGDDAFFRALDTYARSESGRPATTEALQAAFEASSGRDLDAFFTYWIVGANVPELTLTLVDRVGTITSDVPFGTFDVPVVAVIEGKPVERWVNVVDGRGTFELEAPATNVMLDPNGMVLARARKVKR